MNTRQPRGGRFEQRLLDELRALVIAQPPSSSERSPRSPRSWAPSRPRLALVGSVVAAAAVAAAAGLLLLAGGAKPAYAVSRNDDGTVTVEINSLSDAAGLESKLREAGIHAVVVYLPPGKTCKQPWFTPVSYHHGPGHHPATGTVHHHASDVLTRFTIGSHHPTEATLVITTQAAADPSGTAGTGSPESINIAWAIGEVKQCEVVDAP